MQIQHRKYLRFAGTAALLLANIEVKQTIVLITFTVIEETQRQDEIKDDTQTIDHFLTLLYATQIFIEKHHFQEMKHNLFAQKVDLDCTCSYTM